MKGIDLIAKERKRQIDEEKWTAEHDDGHDADELALAAAVYALPDHRRNQIADKEGEEGMRTFLSRLWPWWTPSVDRKGQGEDRMESFKPARPVHYAGDHVSAEVSRIQGRIRELTKAGALIAAEIDRLQRETVGTILERTMDPDARH